MGSWADVEVYNEFIQDLANFCSTLEESCAMMATAAQTCLDNMENDAASVKAAKRVSETLKKYQEAEKEAVALAKALEEERDELIRYLQSVEDMDE